MSKQIFLTGIVDQWMAEDLRFNLMNSSEPVIDIYISCIGGDVNKGFEIANLIQGIQAGGKKDIHTYNLAHADSIATVIFLSADQDKRHAVESSTLFMHEPRFMWLEDITKEVTEKASEELEMQTKRIADFYVKNIEGLTEEEAFELMKNETNLDAEQMINYKIVSEVVPTFEIAAKRGLITNQNNNEMRFGKKQATFALKMADDSILLHEGELQVGSEVSKAGEVEAFTGEQIDENGRTIKIEAGKVIEIIDKVEEVVETEETVVEEVAALILASEEKLEKLIDSKIAALRKEGSEQKVPKIDAVKTPEVKESTQASARKGVKAMMDKIAAKKREERQSN